MSLDKEMPYLAVFEILRGSIDDNHIRDACRRLFIDSDEYRISTRFQDYAEGDISEIADMLYEYCTDWGDCVSERRINLENKPTTYEEKYVTYANYASYICWDFIDQSKIHKADSPASLSLSLDEVEKYLVALWHRYRQCADTDQFFSFALVVKCIDAYAGLRSTSRADLPPVELFALRVMQSFKGDNRF